MKAKGRFRDRDDPQVAVLDALADRKDEGMTVFELRSRVDADIDTLENALGDLKADGLIEVSDDAERTVIVPDERVITTGQDHEETGFFESLRRKLPF